MARQQAITGYLHTSGTNVLDSQNHPVRWFSLVFTQLSKNNRIKHGYCWKLPDPGDYDNVVSWGFDLVRIPFQWGDLEPTAPVLTNGIMIHTWETNYLNALDTVVDELTRRGLAVILKFDPLWGHVAWSDNPGKDDCSGTGMPLWLFPNAANELRDDATCQFYAGDTEPGVPATSAQDALCDLWKFVAARYATNHLFIGADMINEPYTLDTCANYSNYLAATFLKLGTAIRPANSNLLLFFEDAASIEAQNNKFLLSGPPPLPNVVYSYHLYVCNWTPSGKSVVDHFLARAVNWGVPLDMGEFDVFGYQSNDADRHIADPNWLSDTHQCLDYIKPWRINGGCSSYDAGISFFDKATGLIKYDMLEALQAGFDYPQPFFGAPIGSTNQVRLSNGVFQATARGEPKHRFRWQASSDLKNWDDLFTVTNGYNSTLLTDGTATNASQRSYRVQDLGP